MNYKNFFLSINTLFLILFFSFLSAKVNKVDIENLLRSFNLHRVGFLFFSFIFSFIIIGSLFFWIMFRYKNRWHAFLYAFLCNFVFIGSYVLMVGLLLISNVSPSGFKVIFLVLIFLNPLSDVFFLITLLVFTFLSIFSQIIAWFILFRKQKRIFTLLSITSLVFPLLVIASFFLAILFFEPMNLS